MPRPQTLREIVSEGRYAGRIACPACGNPASVWETDQAAAMYCGGREFSHSSPPAPLTVISRSAAARALMLRQRRIP